MSHPPEQIHWTTTATPKSDYPAVEQNIEADVIVVGGGLSGCRTALGLAEAGMSVVLLEERDIGWGASGRSGGQCNPMWRETPDQLTQRFGVSRAEILVKTTLSAADDLFKDIEHFGIDCDPVQRGWVQAAHTSKSRKTLEHLYQGWSEAGARIETIEADDVETMTGSPEYRFALLHRSGGHVQPLSLTRGYASAAVARGARIFCGTRVKELKRSNERWQVRTPGGSVTAQQVVMTTNAYTSAAPWPKLQKTFYPLVSISIATAPLTQEQQASVLPDQVTLSDTRLAIYYTRYDRGGRLIFGCVGSTDHVGTLGGHKRLQEGLHTVFPQLRGIAIERTWSGRIAVTPEMMPHIHEPAPGVTAALGFSGRGIAMTSVMGRALTRKLLGEPENTLPFPVLPIKPIRLHQPLKSLIPLAAPAMTLMDKFGKRIDRS
ncbi:NAD(P)/FAD-dependent oxidoreductase [Granulosicoccus antarcticus]|uniref:Gamma-glutamylputrescine oxidoreductase n=1 Tax=Granulosicoccus antarcticus IMCC3135 TaxID=1192854 RepID=A0A2Z2NQR5_9GAMM|nr:FAD-dependent oxidoreductase [Granulosicoccus antarcticus]ASJ73742.1 Gamma-glutamylputrescine oxidoreductase [Granulosicoccus antarcticus IMCC3135]